MSLFVRCGFSSLAFVFLFFPCLEVEEFFLPKYVEGIPASISSSSMEGDLAELLQKFSLEGNEISGAKLELEDLSSGRRDCADSLIGRIMGEKLPTLRE